MALCTKELLRVCACSHRPHTYLGWIGGLSLLLDLQSTIEGFYIRQCLISLSYSIVEILTLRIRGIPPNITFIISGEGWVGVWVKKRRSWQMEVCRHKEFCTCEIENIAYSIALGYLYSNQTTKFLISVTISPSNILEEIMPLKKHISKDSCP